MTYDDLQEFAGITPDMIGRVDYKRKGKADAPIASEEAQKITCGVTDVRMKTGKNKAGKDYKQYTIYAGGGEYKTFSESNAKIAKEAKEAAMKVEITYKAGQYGNDIEAICITEPEGESDDSRENP
jgi:hypothetical protein